MISAMFSLTTMVGWLISYKYVILFPLVALEGPIVTIICGFLASLGYFSLPLALTVIVLGDLAGDCLHYAVGRWGRNKFLGSWGKYTGAAPEKIARLESHFKRHKIKTLVAGKISHGIGGIPLVAAGAAKMPFGEFIVINFLLTLPKSLALLLVGFYFGQAYVRINTFFELATVLFVGAAFLVGALYFFHWPKKEQPEEKL